MQTYAQRMFNFMRFGEKGNSIVYDLTPQEKKDLKDGVITMDQIYDRVMKDPVKHVMEVKQRGVERILAIAGIIDGNQDFSNGAGKSTLMEAMCYARYERIARRTAQKPDSVEKAGLSIVTKIDGKFPTAMKESWVEELCEIGGSIFRIRRGKEFSKNHKTHSPIMEFECLYENKTDSRMSHRSGDTKKNLEEVLTTDYDLFINSQMFAQNDAGKYLIGTDKTKKEMLIALLRLENIVTGCLENIRKKKNAQEKKIDTIKATIAIIEKSLCKKYQELNKKVIDQLDSNSIQEIDAALTQTINETAQTIKDLEQKIHVLDAQIGDLSKSEKLQKIESIREEGRRISKDKKAKEQAMTDQISEWEKLSKECSAALLKKADQINTASNKSPRLIKAKAEAEYTVKQFDMAKYQEQLQKITKAKQLKPQITSNLAEARKALQKASDDIAILKSNNKKMDADLQKLNRYGDDVDFICPECMSRVTKDHVTKLISSISEALEKDSSFLAKAVMIFEDGKKNVEEMENNISRINDFLISEANLNASMKGFEDAKVKVVDLETQIRENNDALETLRAEKQDLESKVASYDVKVVEIRKQFEEELKELKSKIDILVKQLKQAEEDAQVINNQLLTLKSQRKDIESQKNKAIELYGSALKDETHVTAQITEWTNKRKEYELENKHLRRLLLLEDVYGLDGIQTRIIKRYLPLLNVYIKEFLDILSDGLMSVKMVINDKSKVDMIISGGTSESYEMLSGGEKTIVRLAVDIGLSLLAFSRTTLKPEMICLDEIFGSLDAGRTKNVFKVLNKLSDKFSRIVIISHNAEINNQIRSRIIIEKGGGRMGLSEIKRIE